VTLAIRTLVSTFCGASFGLTFILAFAFIGMRTPDHRRAASLSAMAQATGYLIAAIGPVAFGWLHDLTTGWTVPILSFLAVAVIQAIAGFSARAGRGRSSRPVSKERLRRASV
jgi:MFS transporter, CP family, cyanate transporter